MELSLMRRGIKSETGEVIARLNIGVIPVSSTYSHVGIDF